MSPGDIAGGPGGWRRVSVPGGAAYRDGQGRTRCRRCDKLVYAGEDEAQAAADAAREQRVLLRAYREPACGYWHLTSRAELPSLARAAERARQQAGARQASGLQRLGLALLVVVVAAVVISAFVLSRLGGDEPAAPVATAVPVTATALATPTASPLATATPAATATATARRTVTSTPVATPVPTPEPVVVRTIGNTGGTGVALRDDCDDAARFSARGEGWPDNTRLELIEEGSDRCEGWLQLEADGVAAWVREEYVIARVLSSLWTVGNTGGVGVAQRSDCLTTARISRPGQGWDDGTEVRLLEVGAERCASWLRVESEGVESWVREGFLIEVVIEVDEPTPETWTIGNTGGTGVALRNDCTTAARFSEQGEGWRDATRVELIEVGEGRCEGWLHVEADGVASWVREAYLIPVE